MTNNKTKCDFCKHWTGQSCMVTPNSYYCREANDEYREYINDYVKGVKSKAPLKSLRSWERR